MPTTSSAATPSPVPTAGAAPVGSALPKVLRIGIIVEGKIVQERLVRAGTSVTLGGPTSTFDVTGTGLPEGFELFAYHKADKAYALQAPAEVDGRMHWKGAIASLSDIRGQGGATQKGNVWSYVLNDSVRGKLALGVVTVLFQFVPAPPEPVLAMAESLRPGFIDRDDPLFMSLLGAFGSVCVAFMVVLATAEVQPTEPSIEDIGKASKQADEVFMELPVETDEPAEATQADEAAKAAADEKQPQPAEQAETQAVQPAATPGQTAPAKGSEEAKAAAAAAVDDLFGDIDTTAGPSTDGVGSQAIVLGQGPATTKSGGSAGAGVFVPPGGGGTGSGPAFGGSVGEAKLGTAGAAAVNVAGPAAVAVKAPEIKAPAVSAPLSGDAACVAKTKAQLGKVKMCMQQAINRNPQLDGEITAKWSVQDGAVSAASIVKNSTGDDALKACVLGAVNGFGYGDATCDMPPYTWTVVRSK